MRLAAHDARSWRAICRCSDTKGALVWSLYRSSSAYRAGLRPGDVVVGFNGKPVDDPAQFQRPLLEAPIGSIVTLGILRDGETREIKVQVESQSARDAAQHRGVSTVRCAASTLRSTLSPRSRRAGCPAT